MKVSKETKIKVLVNLKCLGYMGKCVKHFPLKVRGKILPRKHSQLLSRTCTFANAKIKPQFSNRSWGL